MPSPFGSCNIGRVPTILASTCAVHVDISLNHDSPSFPRLPLHGPCFGPCFKPLPSLLSLPFPLACFRPHPRPACVQTGGWGGLGCLRGAGTSEAGVGNAKQDSKQGLSFAFLPKGSRKGKSGQQAAVGNIVTQSSKHFPKMLWCVIPACAKLGDPGFTPS
jgi:hypothetical protein